MIKSFNHKGLRLLWEKDDTSKLPPGQVEKLRRILSVLNAAKNLEPIRAIPGYRLHGLSGTLQGFWSIWLPEITGYCSGLKTVMYSMLTIIERYGK